MGNKEKKNNNDTSEDQPRKEIEEKSRLHLNRKDRDSNIQLLDFFLKQSRQEQLVNPTFGLDNLLISKIK